MVNKFLNKTFCLDLNNSISYKLKKNLVDLITRNGGRVSFILNKNITVLIKNDRLNIDSYKCRTAFKLGIPVLHVDYIHDCLNNEYVNAKEYLIANKENERNFKEGKITRSGKTNISSVRRNIDFTKLQIFNDHNLDSGLFDEKNFSIAKWIVFQKSSESRYVIFELHSSTSKSSKYSYRLRIQKIHDKEVDTAKRDRIEYVMADDNLILLEIFKHFALTYMNDKTYTYSTQLPSLKAGSKQLQQIAWKSTIENIKYLDHSVGNFIEFIWNEAIGDLNELLYLEFGKISIEQINKAECVLRKQKDDPDTDYSDEFHNILLMKPTHRESIKNKYTLYQRFEICQIIRDMIAINESTNWNLRASTIAKYRSIGTYINKLNENDDEYRSITEMIYNSVQNDYFNKQNPKPKIINIYSVLRPTDSLKFNDSLFNYKLLFHGTKAKNLIGILSRGLLLPNYTINEIGVDRSDIGMLGAGIYFSDCINTSLKYSGLSKLRNTRMIAICEVGLGNCKTFYDYDFKLNEAPKNYHSVLGVKSNADKQSSFSDNEYVVYDISQQKLRYLIELQYDFDGDIKVFKHEIGSSMEVDEAENVKKQTDETVVVDKNEIDKLEKGRAVLDNPECGLVSENGKTKIPLKSIHIRVQLLDMISKVHIFQEYENEENCSIEAKYVFPLDDNAAVCGFEAFINDKHIVGVCKEKEEAHREYKAAIEKGHGAYLMDQETNELFKVNIGNLPSNCKCIIKITYVAELNVENENIVFRLPNYIAPWQSMKFKNEKLQNSLITKFCDSLALRDENISLKISIQMPFEIRSVYSPTHMVKIKKTACHAVVDLCKNQKLSESFMLYVIMSAIHVPRMLVEDNPSCVHERACMLSFYPEFETNKIENPNIVFLFDSSNSMSNDSFKNAKKLIQLMLKKLPAKCLFNIVSFGSIFIELFPFLLKYDQNSLLKASDFINSLKQNNGNTDLLNSIKSYVLLNHGNNAELINFILISDGHINEPELLLSTLSNNSKLRFFTCAVASNSNKHLMKMIAYRTNGSFQQFDSQYQSKWKEKVEDIFDRLCQPPAIGNITVEWEMHNKNINTIKLDRNYEISMQAPSKIHSLFNGRRQVVYGFVPNCLLATLKANLEGQEVSAVVNCPELMITKGTIIHKLTAKALIDDWQYGLLCDDQFKNDIIKSKLKSRIVKLSKAYSITSEYTSFIAIEERSEIEKSKKYDRNESTTPSIEVLLEKDADASSIDILPYMCYNEDENKLNEDNLEKILNEIYNNFETINDEEKESLNEILLESKGKISEMYSPSHLVRLKYNRLLVENYKWRNLFSDAVGVINKTIAEAQLNSLNEESTDILQSLKYEIKDIELQLYNNNNNNNNNVFNDIVFECCLLAKPISASAASSKQLLSREYKSNSNIVIEPIRSFEALKRSKILSPPHKEINNTMIYFRNQQQHQLKQQCQEQKQQLKQFHHRQPQQLPQFEQLQQQSFQPFQQQCQQQQQSFQPFQQQCQQQQQSFQPFQQQCQQRRTLQLPQFEDLQKQSLELLQPPMVEIPFPTFSPVNQSQTILNNFTDRNGNQRLKSKGENNESNSLHFGAMRDSKKMSHSELESFSKTSTSASDLQYSSSCGGRGGRGGMTSMVSNISRTHRHYAALDKIEERCRDTNREEQKKRCRNINNNINDRSHEARKKSRSRSSSRDRVIRKRSKRKTEVTSDSSSTISICDDCEDEDETEDEDEDVCVDAAATYKLKKQKSKLRRRSSSESQFELSENSESSESDSGSSFNDVWKKLSKKIVDVEAKWSDQQYKTLRNFYTKLQEINKSDFENEIQLNEYFDTKLLFKALELAGIKSLGLKTAFDIQRLLCNLVFFYIYCKIVLKDCINIPIQSFVELKNLVTENSVKEFSQCYVNDSLTYIEKTIEKYPLLCTNLELSRNWDSFIKIWFTIN